MTAVVRSLAVAGACAGASLLFAGAAAADPMTTPAMTAPLAANPNPLKVDGGAFGDIYVGGAVTGMGMVQNNRAPSDDESQFDLTNAVVTIQNTSGPVQFFIMAGQYAQPFLGVPYIKGVDATKLNFGNVPIAYVKLQPTPELSIQAGKMFPLIGAEYTWTFQNMNVFRGLLVAQEPADSRGVQVNYAKGPISVSVSLNDGFYSDKLNWVTGAFSYVASPSDTFAISAGGAVSKNSKSSFTTLVPQNNGWLANLIWTHTAGPLTITPYLQYTSTPKDEDIGLTTSGETWGGAILAKYSFTPEFSLAGRAEYIKSSSDDCDPADLACAETNLLGFGPGAKAWSLTLTPTYQKGIFFLRGEVSYVKVDDGTPGLGFGEFADKDSQTRGVVETGFIF
jgi:hypothetical protein